MMTLNPVKTAGIRTGQMETGPFSLPYHVCSNEECVLTGGSKMMTVCVSLFRRCKAWNTFFVFQAKGNIMGNGSPLTR